MTKEEQNAVVRIAKSWIGTPYIGWASIRGPKGGTDCGQLLRMVYQEAQLIPQGDLGIDPSYSLQVAQHRADTTYFNLVEQFTHEITEEEVQPGDIVLFLIGHAYAHGGIVTEWPRIVHALAHGGVREVDVTKHPKLMTVTRKIMTLNDDRG
jgi:cell wall-associated NlpC family hydrolase